MTVPSIFRLELNLSLILFRLLLLQGFREAVQANLEWFEGTQLILTSNSAWLRCAPFQQLSWLSLGCYIFDKRHLCGASTTCNSRTLSFVWCVYGCGGAVLRPLLQSPPCKDSIVDLTCR